MSAGGLNATRALLFVSSQKCDPLRCRQYARIDSRGVSSRPPPIKYSSIVFGVMSATNSLPDDDATGSVAKRIPFASKYALIVVARLRSHDAARGSELAAGLYFAKLP